MSVRPEIVSQPLPRSLLSEFLKSQRAIKAFEDMLKDLIGTLPDSIEVLGDQADDIEGFLNSTNATAQEALSLARLALEADPTAAIASLHDRLSALEIAVAQLKEGPTP
jgi:ABC-type transporter Mla subunit MlaD